MDMIPEWQLKKVLEALYEPLPPKPPRLVIEPKAPRDTSGHKLWYHFDKSLKELRKGGYERHLRPAEAFGLLRKSLEDTLSEEDQEIAEDMLNGFGEWLSLAMQREKNLLHCYEDPENLVWDKKKWLYVVEGETLPYSSEKIFDVGALSSGYHSLELFPIDLQQYLYGCTWDELPDEMRVGSHPARLWLPPEQVLWSVGRGDYNGRYDVYTYCNNRASRGVRVENGGIT